MTLSEILAQAKAFVPGVQQMFKNVGMQDQQAGRQTSVKNTIKGLAPKQVSGASDWLNKMNPFKPNQVYAGGIAPAEFSGSSTGSGGGSGTDKRIAQLTAPGYSRNPAEDNELRTLQENSGGGKSEADIARERYEAAKQAILSKLQMMKDEANRLRGEAKKGYDFTTGEVSKNYESLKKLSGEKLQQALEALGLQDSQVQNMYGRVSGNARRAMEGALTRNRMLHRAMGSLGSSFYSNAQGDTTNQGMNTINDTAIEEADKRNAIGTQKSSTTTDFAQNDVAIEAEANQLRQAALQKHNDEVAQANLLEKTYNIDSEQAITEANNNLDSALNQIREYALTSKPVATTGNTYSTLSAKLPNYDAVAPIKSKLDNQQNYQAANKFIADAAKVGTPGSGLLSIATTAGNNLDSFNPASPNYWLNPKKKTSKEDPNQYFINRV